MNFTLFNFLVIAGLAFFIIPTLAAPVVQVVVYKTVYVKANANQATQTSDLVQSIDAAVPTSAVEQVEEDVVASTIDVVSTQDPNLVSPVQALAVDATAEVVSTQAPEVSTSSPETAIASELPVDAQTTTANLDDYKGLMQTLSPIVSQASEYSSTVPVETSVSPSSASSPSSSGDNGFNYVEGTCRFPWSYGNSDNVYPITPSEVNGGWAMSPNQKCTKGSWCPYACESGYYSAQWDPSSVLANGSGSMNGGLYCDNNGVLQTPFPDKAYCIKGVGNVSIRNTLAQSVSACQTVYPGNEAMLIPTVAQPSSSAVINVTPKEYWLGTSSQFYVNLAGSNEDQCIWGDSDKPVGNWGPYVFGAGQGPDGNTYISVVYNHLYLESGFKAADAYNVKINCVSGNCNFPPVGECKCEAGVCSVDNGCTVTLSGDAKAEFELY
ncbi:hypothetical protein AYI68_g3205 [Smittium mucronatum]|uniref:Secreted beta-glucosidase adg3 n=1 Tax=Smittium mucronatum TaxID=133383 RepID=A0A1R0H0K2_9FUNG|nr:hypothetical protein AYI68_g5538 [Smittium mucronatum]OLY82665.1 hypothetical protein AYI68_g3205 [Smittium mucronatum]